MGKILRAFSAKTLRSSTQVFVAAAGIALLPAPASLAQACPNEQLRAEQGYGAKLPDCRAYEWVSPIDKNLADAEGQGDNVESSPNGERVTYFSFTPFPGILGTAEEFPTYLSSREGSRWDTQGLLPPAGPGTVAGLVGFTEDLGEGALYTNEPTLIEQGAVPGQQTYYIRNNVTHSYQLLARDPSGERIVFADSTPGGSRVLFESRAALTTNAISGVTNLYEWDNGLVSLVGVLPGESRTPAEGAVAGPGGPTILEEDEGEFKGELPGGASSPRQFYTQHALSDDGTRISFTDVATGRLYIREPEAERTIAVSKGPAYWRAATPDGRYVFYTEGKEVERKLYRFDVERDESEALTGGATTPDVLGTLGISDDGSYVYFVAGAALAGVGENVEKGLPENGHGNLYVWHEGHPTTFVAELGELGGDIGQNSSDWTDMANTVSNPAQGGKTAQVTPEGRQALFSSVERLTNYNNAGLHELYLYDSTSGRLTCVSCGPNNGPATAEAQLTDHSPPIGAPGSRNGFLTRNLSFDGRRVFFQTTEALVPQDTNGKLDVYEWEEEGEGSCPAGRTAGCVNLISTGRSTSESYFGDADSTGGNVFFFTREQLVSQDGDYNVDIYDARVGGGLAEQNTSPPASCSTGEACHGALTSSPAFAAPVSATFLAEGSLPQATEKSEKMTTKHAKPKKKKRVTGRKKSRHTGRRAGSRGRGHS
jgi:hypothetical protein